MVRLVRETYTDRGVYLKDDKGIQVISKNGNFYWTLNPNAGLMEIKIDGDKIWLSPSICLHNDVVGESITNAVKKFYLNNELSLNERCLSYIFGCRQYKNEIVLFQDIKHSDKVYEFAVSDLKLNLR